MASATRTAPTNSATAASLRKRRTSGAPLLGCFGPTRPVDLRPLPRGRRGSLQRLLEMPAHYGPEVAAIVAHDVCLHLGRDVSREIEPALAFVANQRKIAEHRRALRVRAASLHPNPSLLSAQATPVSVMTCMISVRTPSGATKKTMRRSPNSTSISCGSRIKGTPDSRSQTTSASKSSTSNTTCRNARGSGSSSRSS